jgi:hypothetical protein
VTFPSLVLHDLPYIQVSQVSSLCYVIPTSLLLSQDSGLVYFLLILLPATTGATNEHLKHQAMEILGSFFIVAA